MATTTIPDGLGQKALEAQPADPEDLICWSVTTILGVLDKPGLVYWSAEETAKAAVSIARSLPNRVEEDGRDAVVKWLRDARFRRPKDRLTAAALGTCAHQAAEEYALTGIRPDRERLAEIVRQEGGADFDGVRTEVDVLVRMLDRFDEWLQRFQPAYQAAEVTVYSPTYGYAGTTDAFLTIDGVRLIADYKSSREPFDARGNPKGPYPEVALQLAMYRYAEMAAVWRPRRTEKFRRRYYLLSAAEQEAAVPVPEVDGGIAIYLTPEHCEAYPVRCDEVVHTAALYVLEAARWTFETSKNAIGQPLTAGGDQ